MRITCDVDGGRMKGVMNWVRVAVDSEGCGIGVTWARRRGTAGSVSREEAIFWRARRIDLLGQVVCMGWR